jgi:hypothetical protein
MTNLRTRKTRNGECALSMEERNLPMETMFNPESPENFHGVVGPKGVIAKPVTPASVDNYHVVTVSEGVMSQEKSEEDYPRGFQLVAILFALFLNTFLVCLPDSHPARHWPTQTDHSPGGLGFGV